MDQPRPQPQVYVPAPEPVSDRESGSEPGPKKRAALNRRSFLKWTAATGAAAGIGVPASLASPGFALTSLNNQQAASRFVSQCTFGGDLSLVNQVMSQGFESWLNQQMALPVSSCLADVQAQIAALGEEEDILTYQYVDRALWNRIMGAPDLLRHRIAYSLSQILVIGRSLDVLYDNPQTIASYYDVLQTHAFGNFKDLLRAVALQPSMGIYLSHVNNRKSDPSTNRFPDENFAREIMQLFSIGLFKLNADGSRQLDAQGNPIPTYGNAEITEMAKIFTGLTFAPLPGDPVVFGQQEFIEANLWTPMVMWEPEHEPGTKQLLDGFVVPAGQTGMQDVESAINHLFQHPNVGPFIGRLLIQRLVTANPSPAYIGRVSAVFADNGSGVRGDMKAFIKAILLDPEARNTSNIDNVQFGKPREPFVRWVQLGRAFHATSMSGQFRHYGGDPVELADGPTDSTELSQYPFFSRSVFNFYSPDHQPAGVLADANLNAPELEIIHSYSAISAANHFHRAIWEDYYIDDGPDESVNLDLGTEIDLLVNQGPTALVDHLDLLLTYGTLSSGARQTILDAIMPLASDAEQQVRMALFLFMLSPDYAVQR